MVNVHVREHNKHVIVYLILQPDVLERNVPGHPYDIVLNVSTPNIEAQNLVLAHILLVFIFPFVYTTRPGSNQLDPPGLFEIL